MQILISLQHFCSVTLSQVFYLCKDQVPSGKQDPWSLSAGWACWENAHPATPSPSNDANDSLLKLSCPHLKIEPLSLLLTEHWAFGLVESLSQYKTVGTLLNCMGAFWPDPLPNSAAIAPVGLQWPKDFPTCRWLPQKCRPQGFLSWKWLTTDGIIKSASQIWSPQSEVY